MNKVLMTLTLALASAFAISAAQAETMNTDALRAQAAVQTQAANEAAAFAPFVEPALIQRDDRYYGQPSVDAARREHAAHLNAVLSASSAPTPQRGSASRFDDVVQDAHNALAQRQLAAEYAAYQAAQSTRQAAR